jgi:membrane protease YdiL (CAAX protease family)
MRFALKFYCVSSFVIGFYFVGAINVMDVIYTLIAALLEELFFRVYLFKWMMGLFGFFYALILSSAMFSLVHFNIEASWLIFCVGVLFCLMSDRLNGVLFVVFLHAGLNLIFKAKIENVEVISMYYFGLTRSEMVGLVSLINIVIMIILCAQKITERKY